MARFDFQGDAIRGITVRVIETGEVKPIECYCSQDDPEMTPVPCVFVNGHGWLATTDTILGPRNVEIVGGSLPNR